jgi:hypothetical protein
MIGMRVGDQIGIGLEMLSSRPGSINGKGAQIPGIIPEPE